MRRLILAGVLVTLIIPSIVWAGGAGNPAATVGRENYGFTFEIEEQIKKLDTDIARSRRYVGKVIWGATDRLDLYAKLGASHLRVSVEGGPDFRGRDGMTWGGGGRFVIADVDKPSISSFIDVQVISFESRGEILVARSEQGETWIDKHDNNYRWNEVQFSLVGTWRHSRFSPYIGFGVTNVFGNVERNLYRVTGQAEEFELRETNDFREDAILELILGMDVDIGGSGRVSGEIRLGDTDDVSFFIGVSELLR